MTVRKARSRGFTLVELLVVVMIIGILAVMGIPQYNKTVEISRAQDASSVVMLVAQANRMYNLNNPTQPMIDSPTGAADPLETNNYLAPQDWASACYNYAACPNGASGAGTACCGYAANAVACAWRKTAGSCSTSTPPYNKWGYVVNKTGVITAISNGVACGTGPPACPPVPAG